MMRADRAVGLKSGKIHQNHVRALLHSFENNLTAVWGDVEIANVEVGSQVGQLPLGARLEVDEPKILMLNLSSQDHEGTSSREKGQVSSPTSQGQGRQGMRRALGRDGFHRKSGADVWSRVDN